MGRSWSSGDRALRRALVLSPAFGLVARFAGARESKMSGPDAMLVPFDGPYGGVPPFDLVDVNAFEPAIVKAIVAYRAEIEAIKNRAEPASFENTLAAFEDAGRAFERVTNIMHVFTAAMNDAAMREVEKKMAPVLAAFRDEILHDQALYDRVQTVHRDGTLVSERARLVDVQRRKFARHGAGLAQPQKRALEDVNRRLATLYTTFSQNQLADEETQAVLLDSDKDLAGLPDALKASARAAAEARGLSGRWSITNTRSSAEPFLTYSSRRDLRERVWKMWVSRGDGPGPHDNKPVITEILALRGQRARLLGFPTHAHWILDDTMAKTPDAAMALMTKVWKAAVARARDEVADMQRIADSEKAGHRIEAWDYRFYAEKVRKEKYDLDQNDLKPYLTLDRMREALFWSAEQLFGLKFRRIRGVPVYHPDVTVYEVTRGGQRVGLWYFDPFARPGKRSGAWMAEYRAQEAFKGRVTPIVSNNSNFVKGSAGAPTLISWDDAVTLFHEFGHALHGLSSEVMFPSLAGTSTLRDFVEFPSQLHEHWLLTREVLERFALHHETGKPIPPALVEKIRKAKTFNQGFKTVEYLFSAIYDMKIHTAPTDRPIDPAAFEARIAKDFGAPREIVMRHRPTHFGHVFADDGYSAGYYSYIWADTLTADAAEAFVQAGGYYDKAVAKRLREAILRVGNSIPPDEAFRRFRGRDVDTNALMRDRGFPVTP
jgi:peptidyl-dipeptidase Dcp